MSSSLVKLKLDEIQTRIIGETRGTWTPGCYNLSSETLALCLLSLHSHLKTTQEIFVSLVAAFQHQAEHDKVLSKFQI